MPIAAPVAEPVEEPPEVVESPPPAPPAARTQDEVSLPAETRSIELVRTCDGCGTQFPADRNRCPDCHLNFKLGSYPDEEERGEATRDPRVHLGTLLVRHPRGAAVVCGFIAVLWFFFGAAETQAAPIFLVIGAATLMSWGSLSEHLARDKAGLRSRRRARRARRVKRRQAREARRAGRTRD